MIEPTATTLDVRQMAPRERHPTILSTFDALAPGEARELVNDHDPKPLRYQFEAELPGTFTWDYLEEGPEAWRVRIGKGDRGRPREGARREVTPRGGTTSGPWCASSTCLGRHAGSAG